MNSNSDARFKNDSCYMLFIMMIENSSHRCAVALSYFSISRVGNVTGNTTFHTSFVFLPDLVDFHEINIFGTGMSRTASAVSMKC